MLLSRVTFFVFEMLERFRHVAGGYHKNPAASKNAGRCRGRSTGLRRPSMPRAVDEEWWADADVPVPMARLDVLMLCGRA